MTQEIEHEKDEVINAETGTEDTLKARVPEWVYKECKKIGAKKKEGKEETRKTIFIPHEERAAQQNDQEAQEEVIGDTPQRNEEEEETLPGRPILLPKAGRTPSAEKRNKPSQR